MTIGWFPGRTYPATTTDPHKMWSYPTEPLGVTLPAHILIEFAKSWSGTDLPDKLDEFLTCEQRSSLSDLLNALGSAKAHHAWESKTCHACAEGEKNGNS